MGNILMRRGILSARGRRILLLFGRAISAIAMPALAGLLIVVGYGTLKIDDIRMVWQTGSMQQLVMAITFGFTLVVPLQYAVLVGVALAIILFVGDLSNKITVKEWTLQDGQLPIEQDPSEALEPNKVTVLVPFGSLFFAAATTFEEALPVLDDDTRNAVVIIRLRGKTDLGSTFLGILERYATELRAHESKLMLAGISDIAKGVLEDTGQMGTYGRDNVFVATEVVGESLLEAHHAAEKWVSNRVALDMAEKEEVEESPVEEVEESPDEEEVEVEEEEEDVE
jgi:SulP family sulfate permease